MSSSIVVTSKFPSRRSSFERQYCHIYMTRLGNARPKLESRVSSQWPGIKLFNVGSLLGNKKGDLANCQYVELCTKDTITIIGTILKEQPEKPTILDELSRGLTSQPIRQTKQRYISANDKLKLEDDSGRIRLLPVAGSGMRVQSVVNGLTCALRGTVTNTGMFKVTGVLYPEPSPKESLFPKTSVKMAFVSGIEYGSLSMPGATVCLLFDFLESLAISDDEISDAGESKCRPKVFFLGNTFGNWKADVGSVQRLDRMLSSLANSIDVVIIPGEDDPSGSILPQPPIHRTVLPLSYNERNFLSLTNPARVELPVGEEGGKMIDILLSNGMNVTDMWRNCESTGPLNSAQLLVSKFGHQAPTAPDSLPLDPNIDDKLFVIDEMPDIFVFGNEVHGFSEMEYKNTRYVAVPKFAESRSIVLVDETLKSSEAFFMVA